MRTFLKKLKPPVQWRLAVIITLGIASGFSGYIFYISRAWSYVSDKPETCINCHVMAPQYATWIHSSHKQAVCNDCHVPHNNVFNKYFFKAKDGMRHASMFTLHLEPQVIYIKQAGKDVVQANCQRCHSHVLMHIADDASHPAQAQSVRDRYCWECHRETPHGRVNSLSAVPFAQVPLPQSPVPAWMSKLIKQ